MAQAQQQAEVAQRQAVLHKQAGVACVGGQAGHARGSHGRHQARDGVVEVDGAQVAPGDCAVDACIGAPVQARQQLVLHGSGLQLGTQLGQRGVGGVLLPRRQPVAARHLAIGDGAHGRGQVHVAVGFVAREVHAAFDAVGEAVLQFGGVKAQRPIGVEPALAIERTHGQHIGAAWVPGVGHGQAHGRYAFAALGLGLRAPDGGRRDLPLQAARHALFARGVAVHKTAAPAGAAVQAVAQRAVGVERAGQIKIGAAPAMAACADLHGAQRLSKGPLAHIVDEPAGRDLAKLQRGRALDDFHTVDVEQRWVQQVRKLRAVAQVVVDVVGPQPPDGELRVRAVVLGACRHARGVAQHVALGGGHLLLQQRIVDHADRARRLQHGQAQARTALRPPCGSGCSAGRGVDDIHLAQGGGGAGRVAFSSLGGRRAALCEGGAAQGQQRGVRHRRAQKDCLNHGAIEVIAISA